MFFTPQQAPTPFNKAVTGSSSNVFDEGFSGLGRPYGRPPDALDRSDKRYSSSDVSAHYNMMQSSTDFTSFHNSTNDGGFLAGATQDTSGNYGSAADRRRGGDGHTIHPMKISMIQQYFQDNPQEHRLSCFGTDVSMFKLIGLVRDLKIDSASEKWSFTLDDGSGVMAVEWLPMRHLDFPEAEPSPWMKEQLSKIQNCSYMRVHGDVNLLGCLEPRVSAFFVSAVEVVEEIFYHDIQVAEMIIRSQSPNPTATPLDSLNTPDSTPVNHPPVSFRPPNLPRDLPRDSHMPFDSNSLMRSREKPFNVPGHSRSDPSSTSDLQRMAYGAADRYATADTSSMHRVVGANGDHLPASKHAQSILEILKNMTSLRPNGLSDEEILTHLVGRGLGTSRFLVDSFSNLQPLLGLGASMEDVQRECNWLLAKQAIMLTPARTWRLAPTARF